MLKKLLLPIFFICTYFSYAQQHTCGTDQLHQQKMIEDPKYRMNTENFEEFVQSEEFRKFQARTVGATTVYTIPVVFHVMHKGEAVGTGINISDQAIYNSIKSLNSRFRKQGGGIGDGNGVDVGIEFALAVRDPNGNCTNGIVRYDMTGEAAYMQYGIQRSGTNGITDTYLKSLSFWDSYDYYNIWVISEIDDNNGGGGIQGYAYFASAHGASYDGAVMLTNCITDTARVTLPHELGHAFNLYHTFEGDGTGATCPANAACLTDGDRVCDTPPHMRSPSNCNPGGTNTCDGGSSNALFVHNYMDYASDDCQNEFTAGQRTRVIAALTTRASLLEENGNMSLVPPTTANVNFFATKTLVCTGQTIQLFDNSGCIPNIFINSLGWPNITFNWTVTNNAGTTLTSTTQNPVFTMNVAGTYDVTLSITNPYGTTSFTKQGMIIVTTAPIAPTCTGSNSSPGTNLFYGIYGVYLNTLSHTSDGTYQDIQSGVTNGTGYGDFSCVASTVLTANTTYTFTLKGSSNTGITEDFKVYIDYNNDGDFVDAGEEVVFLDDRPGVVGTNYTANFTTPAAPTLNIPLRMRVFSARSTETITPCFATSRGQIQDYSVIISNKVASVTIAAAPSTTISYGTNVTFTATPVNGGAGPTYKWYVNGVLQVGFNGNTFSSSTLLNGDQIYCIMTSNLAGVIASPATSNTLTMVVTGPPISNFTQNKTVLCAGSTVTYTDQSLLAPTSWSWTFGGGTPGTSATQNPTITYSVAGVYNTTLTASNGFGTGTTNTKTNLITVSAAPPAICSGFTRTNDPSGTTIGIHRVTINTINNSTTYTDAVFIDNSCTMITTLQPNVSYNIEVVVGSTNIQRARVFIDYNGNNVFTDAGETVFSPANGNGVLSGSFTVPASAVTTKVLRMRVMADFGVTPTSCGTTMNYGQVEDYGILIDASALPISLTSLKANRLNSEEVRIDWTLAQFSDVERFVIEKSLDGQLFTEERIVTPTQSFSIASTSYQILDDNDYLYTSYYRLKTVYIDGTQEYSNSVPVKGALNSFTTQVAPVPVSGNELTVYSSAVFEEGQWEIYSASGALQAKGKLEVGNATMSIPTSALVNGHYFIKITGVTQSSVNRFCVLR